MKIISNQEGQEQIYLSTIFLDAIALPAVTPVTLHCYIKYIKMTGETLEVAPKKGNQEKTDRIIYIIDIIDIMDIQKSAFNYEKGRKRMKEWRQVTFMKGGMKALDLAVILRCVGA